MKSIFITILCVLTMNVLYSQQADKTVSITVSGSGKTQDEAKQSALRSAIEQAFGAFISSKTEILNDQLLAEQITSVATGNIQSYSMLNESQLPNGSWGVTLKAIVSVSKLTSFVESKGIAIEFKGGLFAINIKQQMLNEQGEINAIHNLEGLLHETMQTAFDYTISYKSPKSQDSENKNWEIPLTVTVKTNQNIDFCANYCINTLSGISLSADEVATYKDLNKTVYPVTINSNGRNDQPITFYLRNKASLIALESIGRNWEFYNRLFTIESSIKKLNGIGKTVKLTKFLEYNNKIDDRGRGVFSGFTLNFLTANIEASIFEWNDLLSIDQVEKMDGYKVIPRGKVSHLEGLYVIYDTEDGDIIFDDKDLDEKAGYPGGVRGWQKFLQMLRLDSCNGKLVFQCVVNTDGSIQDLKLVSESLGLECEREVILSINNLRFWSPGKKEGKLVRSRIFISLAVNKV